MKRLNKSFIPTIGAFITILFIDNLKSQYMPIDLRQVTLSDDDVNESLSVLIYPRMFN